MQQHVAGVHRGRVASARTVVIVQLKSRVQHLEVPRGAAAEGVVGTRGAIALCFGHLAAGHINVVCVLREGVAGKTEPGEAPTVVARRMDAVGESRKSVAVEAVVGDS